MFFPCKAVSEDIIYRYKYILLKAGIKLLTTATVFIRIIIWESSFNTRNFYSVWLPTKGGPG